MLCADFAVFGKVSASLAHQPDGDARKDFTAAGAKEQVFPVDGRWLWGHSVPEELRIANPRRSC